MEIPEETAGPYPGDGSNGPNVLAASGVVRQDITASFGTGSGKAEGVPLTFTLTLLDNANGCVPLAGAAVYAWHCDREGRYSLYDSGLSNENYLRGVQEADANGQVTFTSSLPRRLLRALAAHPFRSVRVHEQRHRRRTGAGGVTDCADEGRL